MFLAKQNIVGQIVLIANNRKLTIDLSSGRGI